MNHLFLGTIGSKHVTIVPPSFFSYLIDLRHIFQHPFLQILTKTDEGIWD